MSKHKDLQGLKCPTRRDIESFLEGKGWELESQNGSHRKWKYKNGAEVIVAGHGNQPIPKGTWCAMRKAILAAMSILLVLAVILPLVIL